MSELKTEPGWKPAREPAASRKHPWWAVALLTGIGAGAALAAALGLTSMQARGNEPPPVRTSGVAAAQTEAEWRHEVMQSLQDLRERMARIEGRLERK